MKKFMLKASIFCLPFYLLYLINFTFYNPEKGGDLIYIGTIYNNPTPKTEIKKQYSLPKKHLLLSEIDISDKHHFDIITLGDSFTNQAKELEYNNYLAHMGYRVLNIDRHITGGNPIQTLNAFINSDFFDNISADYIILESVERLFNKRNKEINHDITISLDSITQRIKTFNKRVRNYDTKFFSDDLIKIPFVNLMYNKSTKPIYSKTYKYHSSNIRLFSNQPDNLLFMHHDIDNLHLKNDKNLTENSIQTINKISRKLKAKNISLMMLIAPDKYDLYSEYIDHHSIPPKSKFFRDYNSLKKQYINIDAFTILKNKIPQEKDIYYYDDSHWTPKGAQYIAKEIDKIIKSK